MLTIFNPPINILHDRKWWIEKCLLLIWQVLSIVKGNFPSSVMQGSHNG